MPEKVTSLNGLKVTLEYGSYNMSAHNVYYVKCNVVLNNVIFDSCLFPHQHYDRHSFHARECCAIRQNVRGDKSSMAFNNHFAHYSLFSYSKSQGNSFSHTCCLYCPAYLTAVAFSDRTRHGILAFTLCHHQCQINETIRESPFIVVPRQNFDHITANHQR